MRAALIAALLLLLVSGAGAQQIILVYPRAAAGETCRYPATLDSTFIFGHVEPPRGELYINGTPVTLTARGAFLAWLPLAKDSANRAWRLQLRQSGREVAALRFPYTLGTDSAVAGRDSLAALRYPRVLRVAAHNAHARTAIDGSYFLFPDSGCVLLASGHEAGFFQIDLGGGLWGVIEDRFVTLTTDTTLPQIRAGRGTCGHDGDYSWCDLALPARVAWSSDLSADGRTLQVTLYGVRAAIDRIRFDVADNFLRDIVWRQEPAAVTLEFRCAAPIRRGYDVTWYGDSLRVRIRKPAPETERGLKGKTIVIDPGHGGGQFGAIGPLGTLEKDVVLRWAILLADELRQRGAKVVLTRDGDIALDLYERIALARKLTPDFFISLHGNALPDDENPVLRHGSGTYYFQSASRPAAQILHRHLLKASGLRDDGLYDANLAVVRPTAFPAVLVEAAYLMNPAEEELLQSEAFLRTLARGLARGLVDYFQSES